MITVRCPDCGRDIGVRLGARSGDVITCPNRAGLSLRLREENGRWSATIAHTVSCPNCDRTIVLSEDARAGDFVECCGHRYRLTFEYGAFAAEETSR
ncbi:MAG: hypothetical protein ACREF4_04805 [Gammaproteobacteria bacterium]